MAVVTNDGWMVVTSEGYVVVITTDATYADYAATQQIAYPGAKSALVPVTVYEEE